MLSGGERALTAVALLFAMLEVRPVPFCVLDEVDAALDEANIGRFADALRSLADQTQFIVITHNRGTIEAADALYGVTVGDDSVTRVISLRLDEAQALAARAAGGELDRSWRLMPFWRRRREERRRRPDARRTRVAAGRDAGAGSPIRPTASDRRRPSVELADPRPRRRRDPAPSRRPTLVARGRLPRRRRAGPEPGARAGAASRPEPTPAEPPAPRPRLRALRSDRVPGRRRRPTRSTRASSGPAAGS